MTRKEQREQAFCLVFQDLFNNDEALAVYEENVAQIGEYARVIFEGVISKKDELDEIEEGKANWVKVLDKFYSGFDKTLKSAEEKMDGTRVKVPVVESDVVCEVCG